MCPALTMVALFVPGFVMVVTGGLGFMRGNPILMQNRRQLSQGVVFAAAGFMFVAGMEVDFAGSSQTAFLKGQM